MKIESKLIFIYCRRPDLFRLTEISNYGINYRYIGPDLQIRWLYRGKFFVTLRVQMLHNGVANFPEWMCVWSPGLGSAGAGARWYVRPAMIKRLRWRGPWAWLSSAWCGYCACAQRWSAVRSADGTSCSNSRWRRRRPIGGRPPRRRRSSL